MFLATLIGMAAAQTAPASVAAVRGCEVQNVVQEAGSRAELFLVCDKQSLRIGSADTFKVLTGLQGGSIAVLTQNGPKRRLTLVTFDSAGSPLLSDLSAELARSFAAGAVRGVLSDFSLAALTGGKLRVSEGSTAGVAAKMVDLDIDKFILPSTLLPRGRPGAD